MARSPVGSARRVPPGVAACLVASLAMLTTAGQADFHAVPRFDGAGYAVLARSLREGSGYRAIDHPDRPLHAHFPPGYPAALALLWSLSGESAVAAHVLSCLLTVGATLAAWCWYRRLYPPAGALGLGLALAVNWVWSRTGSAIQSEPLYEFLGQLAILAAMGTFTGGIGRLLTLAAILAACLLTRQVALGLALAALVDLGLSGRWRSAGLVLALVLLLISPWLFWLISVGTSQKTQAELLLAGGADLGARFWSQGRFYVQRIPDQITGPFVEVATLVRPVWSLAWLASVWALAGTGVVLAGSVLTLRRPRHRLAGLVSLLTLSLLLLWPYTEAGRFLVPLVPFLLVGAVEGLCGLMIAGQRLAGTGRVSRSRLRLAAVVVVLAASIPYTAYSMIRHGGQRSGAANQPFDAACAWIRLSGDRPGPVLTRHPGEVFLATGRRALEVPTAERTGNKDAEPAEVAALIDRYQVAYVLVDDARYLGAAASPLHRFVEARPERVRRVGAWGADGASVVLYEVLRAP